MVTFMTSDISTNTGFFQIITQFVHVDIKKHGGNYIPCLTPLDTGKIMK